MIGAYQINFPGNEFYIGSAYGSGGFEKRFEDHMKGKRTSPKYLQEIALKYGGWSNKHINFVILKMATTKEEALTFEQEYIDKNLYNPLLLNKNKIVMCSPDISKENCPSAKLKLTDVNEIREKYFSGNYSSKILAKEYNITNQNILSIIKNKTWKIEYTDEMKKKLDNSIKYNIEHHSCNRKNSYSLKLNWEIISEIRKAYFNGNISSKMLAVKYGISSTTVIKIIHNRIWKIEYTEEMYNKIKEITKNNGKILTTHCGEESKLSKITWKIAFEIREKYFSGNYTQTKLSKEYNLTRSIINGVLNNRFWKIEYTEEMYDKIKEIGKAHQLNNNNGLKNKKLSDNRKKTNE